MPSVMCVLEHINTIDIKTAGKALHLSKSR